jgi:hypothetical protein
LKAEREVDKKRKNQKIINNEKFKKKEGPHCGPKVEANL